MVIIYDHITKENLLQITRKLKKKREREKNLQYKYLNSIVFLNSNSQSISLYI